MAQAPQLLWVLIVAMCQKQMAGTRNAIGKKSGREAAIIPGLADLVRWYGYAVAPPMVPSIYVYRPINFSPAFRRGFFLAHQRPRLEADGLTRSR